MSGLFRRLAKFIPIGRNRPIGYDLEGNRFYEWTNPAGGRPKRSVEYKIKRDIPEYLVQERLPVQWMSWLSHTRADPPTLDELQADRDRRERLRYNVAQIEARDAAESERRKLLSAPTESADIDPSTRAQNEQAKASAAATSEPVTNPDQWRKQYRQDLENKYPSAPAASSSSGFVNPYDSPSIDHNDPNAPVNPDLRARSQREMELARKRMEVHKSPLSGYVPIDPRQAGNAGRVGTDGVKGDEARGDRDADEGSMEAMSSTIPRPRARRGGTTTASEEKAESEGLKGDTEALASRGRVNATTKSEIQDVQAGSEEDVQRKVEELKPARRQK